MADPRLREYYDDRFVESDRLRTREGQLELERTKDLLRRYVPSSGARIIDIGGGTGVYAAWLASSGHEVHLVDIVQSHVASAAAIGTFSAEVGDARSLRDPDESYDVALLMGPMYHLPDRADRLRALSEARRVVRRTGLIAVSYISRLAIPLDAFVKGWIDKERGLVGLENAVRHGHDVGGGFGAIAYFHLAGRRGHAHVI